MIGDETISYTLIHDPSINHVIQALGDQTDGVPPVYYLMVKTWAKIFSDNPVSLRLFTTLGFCVGITVVWITLRQRFKTLPTAIAVAVILGHSQLIAMESLSIRFYGLLFALISIALFLGIQFCRPEPPSPGLLIANLFIQAALLLCHPLGGFYGAAILFGVLCVDVLQRPVRIRPLVVGSYLLGWLAILLWIRQFLHQADINNPHGWVPKPSLWTLLMELRIESNASYLLFFVLALVLASFVIFRDPPISHDDLNDPSPIPLQSYLVIGLILVAVVPLFWVISLIKPENSIFLSRYLIGSLLGWTILLAALTEYVFKRARFRLNVATSILLSIYILIVASPLWRPVVKRMVKGPQPDPSIYFSGISDRAFDHEDLPIVCSNYAQYMSRNLYSPKPGRYYLPLDWEATNHLWAGVYKFPAAMGRNYPTAGHIVEASVFLRDHPKFLLLDIPGDNWPALFLKPGAYKITPLFPAYPLSYTHPGETPMLLVEKL